MPPSPLPRIGFIGLGVMGAPMAGHLARAGYALTVLDADPLRTRMVAEACAGVRIAGTPREVGAASDIVITMLPNGRIVQQVTLGEEGLQAGMSAGSLLLDTSSSEPWLTRDTARTLAQSGIDLVDAPVSGAQWGAEAAELVFMVGAAPASFERVVPLFERMGRAHFHLGVVSSGHAMKCINNLITAVTFLATSEGLASGARAGLDPAAMNAVLNESTGGSWITRNHIEQRVLSRSFDDPFKLELMMKDINIALDLARETRTPMPLSGLAQQLWGAADRMAGPGASVSEIARWVERLAGAEIAPRHAG